MNTSTVYVDSILSATKESGDIIKSGAKIYGEIGEVISGNKKAEVNQRTVFKSLGNYNYQLTVPCHPFSFCKLFF